MIATLSVKNYNSASLAGCRRRGPRRSRYGRLPADLLRSRTLQVSRAAGGAGPDGAGLAGCRRRGPRRSRYGRLPADLLRSTTLQVSRAAGGAGPDGAGGAAPTADTKMPADLLRNNLQVSGQERAPTEQYGSATDLLRRNSAVSRAAGGAGPDGAGGRLPADLLRSKPTNPPHNKPHKQPTPNQPRRSRYGRLPADLLRSTTLQVSRAAGGAGPDGADTEDCQLIC
ncbi:hypothetical protein J6590_038666 [Homalodisca vitripennis]|nr:hypothetical protein J6590_038666 [Homalodisca vitripennis]